MSRFQLELNSTELYGMLLAVLACCSAYPQNGGYYLS